ncbi:MAG: AzlC family ABC transporter permease [Pseudomonadota bacterium]
MLNKKSFTLGLYGSIPICIAFTLLFSSLGLLSNAKGLTLLEATVLTATIFAGPSQVFVMDNQDLSLWALALNIFVLNFKFVLMSAMILPLWPHGKRFKVPALYFMCSSAYLVHSTRKNVADSWSYYMGVVSASYIVAILFTAVGYLAWDAALNHRSFLNALAHIVLPAHFVCLIVKRKAEPMIIVMSLVGILATPMLEAYIGKQLLILAWFFIAFAAVQIEGKLCGK